MRLDIGYQGLIERIATDDALAKTHRLDALRETLTLGYPSWILALAMGAGKTVLIGAIVATEFAMALEYPDAEADGTPFIENALVFAPGTTILESLRELSRIPFDRILPPRLAAGGEQLTLADDAKETTAPRPAQLSFTVHRVNDYDLQIQHNEARELTTWRSRPARTCRSRSASRTCWGRRSWWWRIGRADDTDATSLLRRTSMPVRTTITLPEALPSDIDALVGPRGRSGFLARAARNELKRERLRRALDTARGATVGTTGWRSADEIIQFVDGLSEDRDPWVTQAGDGKRA